MPRPKPNRPPRYNIVTGRVVHPTGTAVRRNPQIFVDSEADWHNLELDDPEGAAQRLEDAQVGLRVRGDESFRWKYRVFRGNGWAVVSDHDSVGAPEFVKMNSPAHRDLVNNGEELRIHQILPTQNPKNFRELYVLADHPGDIARLANLNGRQNTALAEDRQDSRTRKIRREIIAEFLKESDTSHANLRNALKRKISGTQLIAVQVLSTDRNPRIHGYVPEGTNHPMAPNMPGLTDAYFAYRGRAPTDDTSFMWGKPSTLTLLRVVTELLARAIAGPNVAKFRWGRPGLPKEEFLDLWTPLARSPADIKELHDYLEAIQSRSNLRVAAWPYNDDHPLPEAAPVLIADRPMQLVARPTPCSPFDNVAPRHTEKEGAGLTRGLIPSEPLIPRGVDFPCGARSLARFFRYLGTRAFSKGRDKLLGFEGRTPESITEQELLTHDFSVCEAVPLDQKSKAFVRQTGRTEKLFDANFCVTWSRLCRLIFLPLQCIAALIDGRNFTVRADFVPWVHIPKMACRKAKNLDIGRMLGFYYVDGHCEPIIDFAESYTRAFIEVDGKVVRKAKRDTTIAIRPPSSVQSSYKKKDVELVVLHTDEKTLLQRVVEVADATEPGKPIPEVYFDGELTPFVQIHMHTDGMLANRINSMTHSRIETITLTHLGKDIRVNSFPDDETTKPSTQAELKMWLQAQNELGAAFRTTMSWYGPDVLAALSACLLRTCVGFTSFSRGPVPENTNLIEIDRCFSHGSALASLPCLPVISVFDVIEKVTPQTVVRDFDLVFVKLYCDIPEVALQTDSVMVMSGGQLKRLSAFLDDPFDAAATHFIRVSRTITNHGLKPLIKLNEEGASSKLLKGPMMQCTGMMEKKRKNRNIAFAARNEQEASDYINDFGGELAVKRIEYPPIDGHTMTVISAQSECVAENGGLPVKGLLKAEEMLCMLSVCRKHKLKPVAMRSDAVYLSADEFSIDDLRDRLAEDITEATTLKEQAGKMKVTEKHADFPKRAMQAAGWIRSEKDVFSKELNTTVPKYERVKIKAFEYPDYPDSTVFFHGPPGTGKTFSCADAIRRRFNGTLLRPEVVVVCPTNVQCEERIEEYAQMLPGYSVKSMTLHKAIGLMGGESDGP